MENRSVAELKNDLHRFIVETDDEVFLEEIRLVFYNYLKSGPAEDWWDKIGEHGKSSIKKGLEQAREGKFTRHTEVRKEINQMFENRTEITSMKIKISRL